MAIQSVSALSAEGSPCMQNKLALLMLYVSWQRECDKISKLIAIANRTFLYSKATVHHFHTDKSQKKKKSFVFSVNHNLLFF